MIDCAKGFAELTFYEGARRFVESPACPIVARNVEQAWFSPERLRSSSV
jgi:hypothetical protein